jgi:dihydrofolate reductase
MKASVFVGTSVDGLIVRHSGDYDFLREGGGEPHGYDEFVSSVDVLVIGRNTFEKILTFNEWPYGEKRVIVLSSRGIDVSNVRGATIEHMSGSPGEITNCLAASGVVAHGGGFCLEER